MSAYHATNAMRKTYSIGETAKIMGISVQTLRNYTNAGLVTPDHINESSGYRYYSFSQFHIIDRIKYLRQFDLSLSEIKEIMADDHVDRITSFLQKQHQHIEQQIKDLETKSADIQWYIDYFKYLNESNHNSSPHISYFPTRRVLYTPCESGESIEDIEVRLSVLKTIHTQQGFRLRRQYGYCIDYKALMHAEWTPLRYFTYISDSPPSPTPQMEPTPYIMEFPAGNYLCLGFRLRHMHELDLDCIHDYTKRMDVPPFVIANEYEDNLRLYSHCPYELQIYLPNH